MKGLYWILPVFVWPTFCKQDLRVTLNSMKSGSGLKTPPGLVTFRYILRPSRTCVDKNVSMVILVHSAVRYLKQRQMIRQTWGNTALLDSRNVTLVFVLGEVRAPSLMARVQLEAERYSDIVQAGFLDSYKNLTYKFLSGLTWLKQYCPRAPHVLKIDNDVIANIPKVFRYIKRKTTGPVSEELVCTVKYRAPVVHHKWSYGFMWYVTKEEFPGNFYPDYCNGCFVLMKTGLAMKLLEESFRTPLFWIDDVYVTGILAKRVLAAHTFAQGMYLLFGQIPSAEEWDKNLFALTYRYSFSDMYKVWTVVKNY